MNKSEREYYVAQSLGCSEWAKRIRKEHIAECRKEATKLRYGLIRVFGSCQLCGCRDADNLELHHILPLQFFGDNDLSNLTVLCKTCHTMLHKAYSPFSISSGEWKTDEINAWLKEKNVNRDRYCDYISHYMHGHMMFQSVGKYKEIISELMHIYVFKDEQ